MLYLLALVGSNDLFLKNSLLVEKTKIFYHMKFVSCSQCSRLISLPPQIVPDLRVQRFSSGRSEKRFLSYLIQCILQNISCKRLNSIVCQLFVIWVCVCWIILQTYIILFSKWNCSLAGLALQLYDVIMWSQTIQHFHWFLLSIIFLPWRHFYW